MSKKHSVEKFHLTGKGAVCVLNEKSGCWEYELPDKGKIVLWIDPSNESLCVYLCIEVQDVNGKTLSEKENGVFIAHAVMFDPLGLCMLPFRPMKTSSAWQFPYDDWMRMYAPEQTSSFSVMVFFYPNPFGVEYLVIPERPELFSWSGKHKSIFLKQRVIEKMKFFKAKFQENDEEIKEKLKERNQMIEEEWKEWEDRIKEDWEREALKKQERQQSRESDQKKESCEKNASDEKEESGE